MLRITLTTLAIALGFAVAPHAGDAASPYWLDRAEDRADRREDHIDRQIHLGPRDVIEDRVDLAENRLDRRRIDPTPRVDRHPHRRWPWSVYGTSQ